MGSKWPIMDTDYNGFCVFICLADQGRAWTQAVTAAIHEQRDGEGGAWRDCRVVDASGDSSDGNRVPSTSPLDRGGSGVAGRYVTCLLPLSYVRSDLSSQFHFATYIKWS